MLKILNGFCIDVCPLGYGEKNGIEHICQKCDDNEINFNNKCVLDKGRNYNYGTLENPSYPDDNNEKLQHACLEYVSYKNYVLNHDSNKCPEINCPEFFYAFEGDCFPCPEGCGSCFLNQRQLLECPFCEEHYGFVKETCFLCNYKLGIGGKCTGICEEEKYTFGKDNDVICVDICGDTQITSNKHHCFEKCDGLDQTYMGDDVFCLEDCDKDYPEFVDGKCTKCPMEGLFNYEGKCMRKEEDLDEIYFILPGEENEKFGKVGSCYYIDELGDFHPKKNITNYYSSSELSDPSFCKNDCPSTFIKKYDANGEIYCTKCFETCDTCTYTGVPGNHKCTSCKEGYEPSPRMFGVCDQICKEGEFFYYTVMREKVCCDVCPDEKPYMAEPEDDESTNFECISNCADNNQLLINETFNCVKECPEGYYEVNQTCVSKCPEARQSSAPPIMAE